MKPLAYVAGPYTHPDPVLNTRRAVDLGDRLDRLGFAVVIPHLSLLWHLVSPQADPEVWYRRDLDVLAHCDLLVRFPGESSGADREVVFAIENGLDVFLDEVDDQELAEYVAIFHTEADVATGGAA